MPAHSELAGVECPVPFRSSGSTRWVTDGTSNPRPVAIALSMAACSSAVSSAGTVGGAVVGAPEAVAPGAEVVDTALQVSAVLGCTRVIAEGIAQVLFFESDEICDVSYKDRGGKYQGQVGVTLPKT